MSAYVVPLEELHGWARAEVSLINVSGIMGLALGGLLTGSIADRFGTRSVVLAGSTVMGTCYLTASLADELWQYYSLMFIAGLFGAAGKFAPIMSLVGKWFPIGAGPAIGIASAARRGFAIGVVTMFGWFGHANGGFLGGYVHDMTGGYAAAYGLAALSGMLNLMVVGVLYWKVRGPGSAGTVTA